MMEISPIPPKKQLIHLRPLRCRLKQLKNGIIKLFGIGDIVSARKNSSMDYKQNLQ